MAQKSYVIEYENATQIGKDILIGLIIENFSKLAKKSTSGCTLLYPIVLFNGHDSRYARSARNKPIEHNGV